MKVWGNRRLGVAGLRSSPLCFAPRAALIRGLARPEGRSPARFQRTLPRQLTLRRQQGAQPEQLGQGLPQLPRQPHDRRCAAPVDGPSELVELFPGPIRLLQRPISCPYGPQNRPGQAVRPSTALPRGVRGLKGLKKSSLRAFSGSPTPSGPTCRCRGSTCGMTTWGVPGRITGRRRARRGEGWGDWRARVPIGRNGMVGRCASEIVHPNIIISKYNQDIVSPMHTPHLRIQL